MTRYLLLSLLGLFCSFGAKSQLVITEIMYNNPGTDFLEFVELQNAGSTPIDLTGYTLQSAIDYTFPSQMLLPNEYVILCVDAAGFMANFGIAAEEFSGALNNSGETIEVYDASNVLVDEVAYDDGPAWPEFADGSGSSLVLCDVNADNNDPANWQLSTTDSGIVFGAVSIFANPGADNQCSSGPIISFFEDERTVSENVGSITLDVFIENPDPTMSTAIDVMVGMASTVDAMDFTLQTMSLNFPAGVSVMRSITIDVIDDMAMESAEDLIIELIDPNNNSTFIKNQLQVTITDNDAVVSNSLVLAGIFDSQPGFTATKGIELYVLADIADLSVYGIGVVNNGGGTDGEEYSFPPVSASEGTRIFVVEDSLEFHNYFGLPPTFSNQMFNMNGDDAIELYEGGQVIDVFGDIENDGTGAPWEYLDGWAYRNSGTGPDGNIFVIDNWTFGGVNALNGGTDNASAPNPYPLGIYSPEAPVLIDANDDLNLSTPINEDLVVNVLSNDITPSDITSLTVIVPPTSGMTMVNADNTITYMPNMDYCGPESFEYEVCDFNGCDTAMVNIEVECPPSYPVYTVAQISGNDALGFPDSIDVTTEIEGLVYGVNLTTDGVLFALIDANNDGITIFNGETDFGYTVNEGDQIRVQGSVGFFNGLTELIADTIIMVTPTLTMVTPTPVTALDESTESQLITLEAVNFIDVSDWGTGTSGFNALVTDGPNTYEVRIDAEVDIFLDPFVPDPGQLYRITGIGGQFDNSSPYDEGYQILPRYLDDIELLSSTQDLGLGKLITIQPNPVKDKLFINMESPFDALEVFDLNGKVIKNLINPDQSTSIDFTEQSAGVYFVRFYLDGNSWVERVGVIK